MRATHSILLLVLLVCIIIPSTSAHAGKMVIAVLDFKADGVAEATARRASELIRTEMINAGSFNVIERKEMGAILKEQGFQQLGCTDTSCAVKIGKLLSARKILVGTVMKLGGSIVINGRIVDVEKGLAEFGEKEEALNEKGLFKAVARFAERLSARIRGEYVNVDAGRAYSKKLNYHSPALAGVWSVAPFWSGSWNNGFDKWGLTFVVVKVPLVIAGLVYYNKSENHRGTADVKEREGDYRVNEALGNQSTQQVNVQFASHYYKLEQVERDEQNKAAKYAKTAFIVYAGITLIDIIYSVAVINDSNAKNKYSSSLKPEEGVQFTFQPRLFLNENISGNKVSADGFDLAVTYRF